MERLIVIFRLVFRLGVTKVIRNLFYRIRLKLGVIKKQTPITQINIEKLFDLIYESNDDSEDNNDTHSELQRKAKDIQAGIIRMFSHETVCVGSPPNWSFVKEYDCSSHWTDVAVNVVVGNDVKNTWELSRFHWFLELLTAYKQSGNMSLLQVADDWCVDWCLNNPSNQGVNWVCAQESSIRMIHVLTAISIVVIKIKNRAELESFVVLHCERIITTLDYSISQDNNHGTSEAAGLFIGGSWLLKQAKLDPDVKNKALKWRSVGRKLLEKLVKRLVLEDGGFSMYSVTYHRVLVNTLSIVEYWRILNKEILFSKGYVSKCQKATLWLYNLTDPDTGNAPNLGANDGSNPFIVQSSDYRDFRPSIQLASILFYGEKFYSDVDSINEPSNYLVPDLVLSSRTLKVKKSSCTLEQSGLVILNNDNFSDDSLTAFIKYPHYKFRPMQSDLLHLDLWWRGKNILLDGGSYSYNCPDPLMLYFSGCKGHNVADIDEQEPMPRISKFLQGNWIQMEHRTEVENKYGKVYWSGKFRNDSGSGHQREICLSDQTLEVLDTVTDARESIVLRWRLQACQWQLEGNTLDSQDFQIKIHSDEDVEISLTEGWVSLYYQNKSKIPVLEIKAMAKSTIVKTVITVK